MTKIKICGITNLDDAQVAVEAGADLLGFIFYEPSPRYVTPETVKSIVSTLQAQYTSLPAFVGVFVNTPFSVVEQRLKLCQLDVAQLHGEESPEFVAQLSGRAYKALRPKSNTEAFRLTELYAQISQSAKLPIPGLMLDAYHPNLYGGTGHKADWTTAAEIAQQHPLLLAGSLTPDNVAEAIGTVQPWGVDISSGVEAEKGRKDHGKVRAFVEAVRGHS